MASNLSAVAGNTGLRTLEQLQTRTPGSQLDKNAFLSILAAQLANQDPLSPTSDTEFIAQLAQFSALEQMQSLNDSQTLSRAYSLVGRYVEITPPQGDAPPLYGWVEGVLKVGGEDCLLIGDKAYSPDLVTGIFGDGQGQTGQGGLLDSVGLIGKTVTARVEEEGETHTLTGVVTGVKMGADGIVRAVLEGQDIDLSAIIEVSA